MNMPEDVQPSGIFLLEVFSLKKTMSVRYLACMAMFTALSYVSVLLARAIPNVQGFLSYEPKDAIIVIAGFIFGPLSCVVVSLLCSLLEMVTVSSTGLYGFVMNVVSTCAFAVPAAWIYHRNRTQKGAMLGLLAGVLAMAACMIAWNYVITPFYMGVERSVVAGMLASVFLPFNLVKGGLNAALVLLLYKPVVGALRRMGLVAPSSGKKGRFSPGFLVFSLVVLATFVLLLLVMIGVL